MKTRYIIVLCNTWITLDIIRATIHKPVQLIVNFTTVFSAPVHPLVNIKEVFVHQDLIPALSRGLQSSSDCPTPWYASEIWAMCIGLFKTLEEFHYYCPCKILYFWMLKIEKKPSMSWAPCFFPNKEHVGQAHSSGRLSTSNNSALALLRAAFLYRILRAPQSCTA